YGAKPVYALPQMQTLRPVWSNGVPLLRVPSGPAYPPGTCPRTEDLLSRVLMLSVTPDYTEEDVHDVTLAFQKVVRHLG
ncbi:MAG TPA: hypothetical protein VGW38_27805, partial [Chloroflexota bacterium]|nr:hypothetical protein [Chloroflexota bacterium]